MHKAILIAASPNTQTDDLQLVLKKLLNPLSWGRLQDVEEFEKRVGKDLNGTALAFDSARSALYVYLKNKKLGNEAEVILPAFSCMVVANAVLWAGYRPIYVDCDRQSYNYDLEDLKLKITAKTKAIIIQHTFGFAQNISKIRELVGQDVCIIEDLAHSLGGSSPEGMLGTLGDVSILTVGIEKVISGVRGGMLVVRDEILANEILKFRQALPNFPKIKTIIALKNPVFWSIITPIYYLGLGSLTVGRLLAWIGHRLGLLGNMIEDCEYEACKPDWLPSKISPPLASLAHHQYLKLAKLNEHRRTIAGVYNQVLDLKPQGNDVYLRFPVKVRDVKAVKEIARKNHIVLGDWYKSILYAPSHSLSKLGYIQGSCPNAEQVASQIINLPTHIKVDVEDAKRIALLVKPFIL